MRIMLCAWPSVHAHDNSPTGAADPPPRARRCMRAAGACADVMHSAVRRGAVQCSAVQCDLRCVAVQLIQCGAVHCSAVQISAVQCAAVKCGAVRCVTYSAVDTMPCVAARCGAVCRVCNTQAVCAGCSVLCMQCASACSMRCVLINGMAAAARMYQSWQRAPCTATHLQAHMHEYCMLAQPAIVMLWKEVL